MVQRSKKAEARCAMCLITVAGYVMNFCLDIGHYAASKHTKQNKSHLMIKQEVAIKSEYHGRLTALAKNSCVCKIASRREPPAGLLPAGIAGERKKQWKLCCLFFAWASKKFDVSKIQGFQG